MGAPKGNQNAKGNKGGKPTDYKPEYARQAYKLSLLGFTDEDFAELWDVDTATIWRWKKKHIEFCNAVRDGKENADAEVAQSFYHRAKGYRFTEERIERDENEQITKVVTYTKELPPDPGAALNWLKNRQKDRWRDKVEHEHSGKVDSDITYKGSFGDGSETD